MVTCLTFNIVMRMIAGKRYYGGEHVKETMKEYADLVGCSVSDFPCVGLGERMDLILQGLIEEHRRDKDRNTMINHLLTLRAGFSAGILHGRRT
uniref:Uncharacterized protein n=1 Tax=Salix viminalis TaxID=40686 RepID=A0A6N2N2L0_SALVM